MNPLLPVNFFDSALGKAPHVCALIGKCLSQHGKGCFRRGTDSRESHAGAVTRSFVSMCQQLDESWDGLHRLRTNLAIACAAQALTFVSRSPSAAMSAGRPARMSIFGCDLSNQVPPRAFSANATFLLS